MNAWLDKTEYPFESKFFNVNGVKLHYIDEGSGDVLLFVHGTPTWSFDFRRLIKHFRITHRCIAIDHIGFGLSDKPVSYDYSVVAHGNTLETFINENRLKNITVIAHDFGGPIALQYGIGYPSNINRLVILNSWLWSSKGTPEFSKMEKLVKSPLLSFLYLYLNFSPKVLLPKSFGDKKIEKNILRHYIKPFPARSKRYGMLAFAKALINEDEWFEQLWERKQPIVAKPTLFVWGMRDAFVKPDYLFKFQRAFLNSQTVTIEEAGHYPHEEQPEKVINAIADFVNHSK